MGLNIAFFGSSLVSSRWNGAATYYRGILRALYDRGHRSTFYEPNAYERQEHRDIDDPPWSRVVVYAGEDGARRCLEEAADADVIVKASGVGVFDELLEASVLELGRPGKLVVFWDVDAPATLERLELDPNDPFARLVPRYALVLTYGGGEPIVERYLALGARACIPIYNGVDPRTHCPVPASGDFASDLSLLANRLPDREARADEFFFGVAARQRQRRFVLGGSGWQDKPLPPNVKYLGHVFTSDHNVFNTSAGAVLNVSRDSMARAGYSPATRLFEAAGAGACIITDAWAGVDHFFEPEREILVAGDGDAVGDVLSRLDARTKQRVGNAARRRVLAQHRYADRALAVERALGVTD